MKFSSANFRENQLVKCSCMKSLQKYGLMMPIKLPDDIAAHDLKKTKKWFCTSETDKIHIQESIFSILNNHLKSRDQLTRFYFTLRILGRFYSCIEAIDGIFFISKRFKEKIQNASERHHVMTEFFKIYFVNQYVHSFQMSYHKDLTYAY